MMTTQRLPVSLKMTVLVLAVWLLAAGCGGPAAVSAAGATSASSTTAPSSFFSEDTIHDISVEFDQADYDDAIAAYKADQSKEWITATVTVDERRSMRTSVSDSRAIRASLHLATATPDAALVATPTHRVLRPSPG